MSEPTRARLRALEDEYIAAVNSAVEEGRDDLVARLMVDYPDAVARVAAEPAGCRAA